MEFNNNNQGKSSPHPANNALVSQQIPEGGHMIPEMGRNQQFFPNHHLQLQPNPFCPSGPTVYSHDVNETIEREMEKRRIREEIIMSEMIRRRELEAEVRREILIERQLALRQMGSDGFRFGLSHVTGFDSSMRLPLPGTSLDSIEGRTLVSNRVEPVPFQRGTLGLRISEVEPVVEAPVEKKKVILVGKPDANTSGSKRNAEPTSIVDTIILTKKVKAEWRCDICQIKCTGEQALKDHLEGKKHRSKKAAAITREGKNYSIGLVSPNGTQPVQAASEHLKNESEEKNGNDEKKMFKFWCDICQMGIHTKRVMKNHERGKKHLYRSLKLKNIEVPVNKVDEDVEETNDDSIAELEDDSNTVVKVDGDGKDASFENVAEPKDDSNVVVKADEDGKLVSLETVAEPKDNFNADIKVDEDGKHLSFDDVEEPKDDSDTVVKDDEDGKRVSSEDLEEAKDNSNAAVEAKGDQITIP